MTAIVTIKISKGLIVHLPVFQVLKHTEAAPVIITVPHDSGNIEGDLSGFFKTRDKGDDGKRAIHGRDKHVWPIVSDIVCRAAGQESPIDAIRFLVPRAYVDANRALTCDVNLNPAMIRQTALDDLRLVPVYHSYFASIGRLVTRSVTAHGKGGVFFIDCHGFAKQPSNAPSEGFDLILGTANRSTIKHSTIDRDFAEAMRAFGYRVFLPEQNPVNPEGDPFSAGHTTLHTAQTFGIDCMQIEIAQRFRTQDGEKEGKLLAQRMSDFFVAAANQRRNYLQHRVS